LLFGLVLLMVCVILLLRFFDPPIWSWKLQRDLNPPSAYPAQIHHRWLNLSQIAPTVQLAVIASEDQRFPYHHGLDMEAIVDALEEADRGKRLRGASTLTQQTVKNLFLWPQRDWIRKALEVALALMLELLWDKQRILEVYLNIVEFGPGVFGIGAASEYWFQTTADRLTEQQAARLAAVLPNPWRYQANPPTPYVAERSHWVESQMKQLGYAWLTPITIEE
ncbi:MAG: monofunctional biosynthetic peptidoglycan transglycosylase, partial [Candidatus Thiodiazotropha sp. 6PLUC3]